MFWLGSVVSLCYIPGLTGAYIATQWPVLAVLLSFGLLRSGPFTMFHAAGLAFLAYAAARLPFDAAPYASVFGLWLVVIMGMSLWFGTTLNWLNMRELYGGLAIGASVSSLLAVLQYFGWNTVPTASAQPAGLYVNSVQQGIILALLAVALASEHMWGWTVALAPGVFLAHSRGAWVALAVGLLACYVRRLWVFGIVAAVGAFYLLSPLSASDTERMWIWHTAWDNLSWFGWGPGMFYTIALFRDGAFSLYPEYAHNDALQLAFEYGVVATVPVAIFGYALWRTDVKEWPVVVAFVTAGCYSMPLFIPITSFLAFVAVGRILRVHALDGIHGSNRRQHVVSRKRVFLGKGGQAIPVASYYSTEGRT